MTEPYDPEADFRPESFIARAGWQAARRPFRAPHEFTLRGRRSGGVEPPPVEEHDAMCAFIAANGYEAEFEGTGYIYFEHGGFRYWVSRGIYKPRFPIINRQPIEAA
jgi:hypothetical protein